VIRQNLLFFGLFEPLLDVSAEEAMRISLTRTLPRLRPHFARLVPQSRSPIVHFGRLRTHRYVTRITLVAGALSVVSFVEWSDLQEASDGEEAAGDADESAYKEEEE
jgi:hypothetical protein